MKPDRIKNWPSRERPRERLVAEGPERLTDAELLAIILRVGRGTFKTGVPGETALALARSLLSDFRGLHGLDRADIRDLLRVAGLSIAKVSQIKAALELGKRLRTNAARPRSFDSASGQANINADEIRSLQLPLPPLPVQQAIMRRVHDGSDAIGKEREKAAAISSGVEREIEEMILGTRRVIAAKNPSERSD